MDYNCLFSGLVNLIWKWASFNEQRELSNWAKGTSIPSQVNFHTESSELLEDCELLLNYFQWNIHLNKDKLVKIQRWTFNGNKWTTAKKITNWTTVILQSEVDIFIRQTSIVFRVNFYLNDRENLYAYKKGIAKNKHLHALERRVNNLEMWAICSFPSDESDFRAHK
jgi:hypothetical protein